MAGVHHASSDNDSLLRRIVQLEHERDELRRNVEQISTSQPSSFSGVDIFSRIQGRRATPYEQELESYKSKLAACKKENTKLEEELSEVYVIKSKFAELLKKEVDKSAGLEKEVKFFQSRGAAALSDRDRAVIEIEKYKRAEEDLTEKMAELQDRLEETTAVYTEEKELCANYRQDLEKMSAENEVYKKVVQRFWKVREQATGYHSTERIQDRAAVLLQDAEDFWSYGEMNKDLQAEAKQAKLEMIMVQEEFQAFSASVTTLQAQVEEESAARLQAESAVSRSKEQLSLLAELVSYECKQIQSVKLSIKRGFASFLAEENNWLLSVSKSWQDILDADKPIVNINSERMKTFEGNPQKEPDKTSEDLEDTISCNHANAKDAISTGVQDVVIEALNNMEYPGILQRGEAFDNGHIEQRPMPLLDDNKKALAQALQEKVAALLLLSQQEERQILEENTTSAFESQVASLRQQLSQVTSEKVNALLELAQLRQELKMLQEQKKNFKALQPRHTFSANGWSSIWGPGVSPEDEKNVVQYASDSPKKLSSQGYWKHLWLRGPELGSRSLSLSHLLSVNRSKENETLGIARLRVENATLRESLWSIRHLCNSANRLRLTIARVAADSTAQTESSIQAAVDAVDGVISEALHLKVALHSSLPVNDSGWNSIGSPLSVTSDVAQDGSDGETNEDLDIVSFFGLEIVRLVLLAAQLQKRFLGQNV